MSLWTVETDILWCHVDPNALDFVRFTPPDCGDMGWYDPETWHLGSFASKEDAEIAAFELVMLGGVWSSFLGHLHVKEWHGAVRMGSV